MENEVEDCGAESDAGLTPVIRTVCSADKQSSGGPVFEGSEGRILTGMHVSLRQGLGKDVRKPGCFEERKCNSSCEEAERHCPHGQMIPGDVLAQVLALAKQECPSSTELYRYDASTKQLKRH